MGVLYENSFCIAFPDDNGWSRIVSGDIAGYVDTDYLVFGEKAEKAAKESAVLSAVVNDDVSGLNVRAEASKNAKVLKSVKAGKVLPVDTSNPVTDDDDMTWIKVFLDEEHKKTGFVSYEYVTLRYELKWAEKYTPYGIGVSDLRVSFCDYAKKFRGTKYVWGGNSLTGGIDCSGFVHEIYKHFGYTVLRNSRQLAGECTEINKSELLPGDLVFYGNVKTGYIDHVAMYYGNGKIIHSSSNYNGVSVSSMYFSKDKSYSIIKCGRFIFDD